MVVVAPEDIRVRLRPRAFMKEAVQLSATPMTTDMWGDESFVFLVLDLRGADVQIAKPPLYNDHRVMDCNITQKC